MKYDLPDDPDELAALVARFSLDADGYLYYVSERRGRKIIPVARSKTNPPQVAIGGKPYRAADVAFYLTYGRKPKPHAYSIYPTSRRFRPEDLREGDARHRAGAVTVAHRHPALAAQAVAAMGDPSPAYASLSLIKLGSPSMAELHALTAADYLIELAAEPYGGREVVALGFVLGARAADAGDPAELLGRVVTAVTTAAERAKANLAPKPRPKRPDTPSAPPVDLDAVAYPSMIDPQAATTPPQVPDLW